ncbi:MAG: efflux RND transporter permease subunit [Gammaproteobacteria bacterium]|nr:efflux RND transporter permease subunit [Gammaproteobacteria bacterium]
MNLYQQFIRHHVLANLLFVLILVIGFLSYQSLPRQQDPTINFNWIAITTVLPGASASDVELRITDPIEDALRQLQNVKFISSNSRDNVSTMLIRFEDIDSYLFDKRVTELRREIQNIQDDLPDAAENTLIYEITSGNAYPTATVAIQSITDDNNMRAQAVLIKKDLEQLGGVDRIDTLGLNDPEIHIEFDPKFLEANKISSLEIKQSIQALFNDLAMGQIEVGNKNWMIRLLGSEAEPSKLGKWPVLNFNSGLNQANAHKSLSEYVDISISTNKATELVRLDNHPAIILSIMKQDNANNIELVEKIQSYLDKRNQYQASTGIKLMLIDDQTIPTQNAISLMQNNALIGLLFVFIVTFIFLGGKIAFLTVIGIPFILSGTFWILAMLGETLNVTVLLAVVIVLGMLVDDAVVIVEAIYYHLEHGKKVLDAALIAFKEVALPVTTAVLTTMAAFLPLMLLPGILGDFMRVIPMVVSIALFLSLIEAFWMLPSHMVTANIKITSKPKQMSWTHRLRKRFQHKIQILYIRSLTSALRHPIITFIFILLLMAGSIAAIATGQVKMNFFAADDLRLFYINIEMPSDSTLENTLTTVLEVEQKIKQRIKNDEVRQLISYAGMMFTEMEPLRGEQYGQILLGLHPLTPELRTVNEMIDSMRDDIKTIIGAKNITFLKLSGGPPVSKPISIKVRGDKYQQIEEAVSILKQIMQNQGDYIEISDDANEGKMELKLQLNKAEISRLGLNPIEIKQILLQLVDGEIISSMRHHGEKLNVRLRAKPVSIQNINELLKVKIKLNNGQFIALENLVSESRQKNLGNIRHYNFRRAITLEANLKSEKDPDDGLNTVNANAYIAEQWQQLKNSQGQHPLPDIDLDFTGELDDIQESIDSIAILFIFGIGVMYLLLGTQFRSYWQPFMILSTVLMAFTGVIIGLVISSNPLSLYTLYGIVALAGIAVNASIVLISAANTRLESGMSLLHSTIYAARRRILPILITSFTTIAGLFSLAVGLGGHSLIWGPVATAIVWGLMFSTILTLFVIPLLYTTFMKSKNVTAHTI